MKRKNRSIILYILIIFFILVVYRCGIRQITEIELREIEFIDADFKEDEDFKEMGGWRNDFTVKELELIRDDRDRYYIVSISYKAINRSKYTSIPWLDVYPRWEESTEDIIVTSNKEWAITPMYVGKDSSRCQKKFMIVDIKGYTKEQVIEMLQKVKGVGVSVTGNWILDLGVNIVPIRGK